MRSSSETKRKRGISVSLTPNKSQIVKDSPPTHKPIIQLEQSHVVCEQAPQRLSYKSIPIKPVVRFEYSHVSKEHELRESLALDQELYLLRKEVEKKKEIIAELKTENQNLSSKKALVESNNESISLVVTNAKNLEEKRASFLEDVKLDKSYVDLSVNTRYLRSVSNTKVDEEQRNEELMTNKENRMKSEIRKKKLKWAEEKMLEIIRVCDFGM